MPLRLAVSFIYEEVMAAVRASEDENAVRRLGVLLGDPEAIEEDQQIRRRVLLDEGGDAE